MQVQYGKYSGFLNCASTIIKERGFRGAFQGLNATILRNVPANAVYFGAYEYMRKIQLGEGQLVSDLRWYNILVAGGAGGVMYWLCTYPLDIVKSTMQADLPGNRQFTTIMSTFSKIQQQYGTKFFVFKIFSEFTFFFLPFKRCERIF